MTFINQIAKRDNLEPLIRKIPKTDLHVHLDGSLRLDTIIDLAKKEKIELPSFTVSGLNELLFKDYYKNLEEYLKTFGYSGAVMQNPENLERIAYEMALDNQQEGVRYIEVRFAPQLHINKIMDMEVVIDSVNKGFLRAEKEFNQRKEVVEGKEPPFKYALIICALRAFGPYSEYYANFIDSLQYSDNKTIAGLCSLELAKGAVKIRDSKGIPIMGFDLAGAEHGNPAKDHRDAFQFAHQHFMAKTVHAGEAYGPSSIFQAITELYAERIGHGYFLFDKTKVDDDVTLDKEKYIEEITQYIADRRVTIEVCLTSNLQTNPSLEKICDHSFKKMMEHQLSVSICTDNRTVSKTTVTNEILLALENFNITAKSLKNLLVYGFKRSFYPGDYSEKRRYVRQSLDYYEKLVKGTVLEA